jgi:membrane protein implicated in regulation of membrane protease activity
MIGFYVFSAILGGVLVLVSIFAGHHDADATLDVDHDIDHGGHDLATWLPFFSLRFWTYFFAATGATGLLLTKFSGSSDPTVAAISLGTGLVCGLLVVFAVRYLSRYDSDSSTKVDDLLGMEARVIVAVRQDQPGKIRCTVKGETLDLLALAQDDTILEAGSEAIIVGMESDKARIVPRAVLYG